MRVSRKVLKYLDSFLFRGSGRKYLEFRHKRRMFRKARENQMSKMELLYFEPSSKHLAYLCEKYGSDKGSLSKTSEFFTWPPHNYTDIYTQLFEGRRLDVEAVFECGIGTNNPNLKSSMGIKGIPGASLRVWKDYFPRANIYGVDIDEEILFQEERIHTYAMNQTEPKSIREFCKVIKEIEFDIIIDDGLHTFEAGSTLFDNIAYKLKPNGIYIIEDVNALDFEKYLNFFQSKKFRIQLVSFSDPCQNPTGQILLIQRRDEP